MKQIKVNSVWGMVGLAMLGVLGCGSSSLQLAYEKVARELPEAERAAKEAGVILHAKDLPPPPPQNPQDNGWPIIKELVESMKRSSRLTSSWKQKLGESLAESGTSKAGFLDSEMRASAREFDAIESALKKPALDFGRDYSVDDPSQILFPEYADLKNLASSLGSRACYFAIQNNVPRACQSLAAMLRLAEFIGSDSTMISGLVRVAIEAITIRQMEFALSVAKDPNALADKLEDVLLARGSKMTVLKMYNGESAFGYFFASDPRRFSEKELSRLFLGEDEDIPDDIKREIEQILPRGVNAQTLSKAYTTRVLQFYTDLRTQLPKEPSSIGQFNKANELIAKYSSHEDPSMAFNRFCFPVFSQAGSAVVKVEANFLCFESLLKVLKFKQANRRWPKTLAEAGAQATDPFDGKPMRYKITGNEVRIYTVGPDLVDDGGSETTGRTSENGNVQRDFASIYPRPIKPEPKPPLALPRGTIPR